MDRINYIIRIVFKIICCIVAAYALVFAAYIMINIYSHEYPYKKSEDFYRSDKDSFETLKNYMDKIYTDGIKYAVLNCETGMLSVTADNGGGTECSETTADANAVSALRYLHDKYADKGYPDSRPAEYNPNFCGVSAEYDENGNMQMRICVWYKPLNMKGDTDNPDKMLYSLIFCEVCKNGGECSKHKYSEPFEEGWYVWSQKGYCG